MDYHCIMRSIKKLTPQHFYSWIVRNENIDRFSFDSINLVSETIKDELNFDGDLLDIFANNRGPIIHKWHHYIPIYSQLLNHFRGTEFSFLEIGVGSGGGIKMWRDYFGTKAHIWGIDVDETCKSYDGVNGKVRIGNQRDVVFLEKLMNEIGSLDVVVDDGSHHMKDIRTSFEFLFPRMKKGGLYIIEDLHTSFWYSSGGGYFRRANFLRFLGHYILGMHHNYHKKRIGISPLSKEINSIYIFDSVVAFRKGASLIPRHSKIGSTPDRQNNSNIIT